VSDWAIIVSAGSGARFGNDGVPKTFRPLAGLPMYVHSLRAFEAVPSIAGIVLVVPDNWLEYAMEHSMGEATRATVEITPGGETRQRSVRAGLARVPLGTERIVVHDAARPLVTPELIEASLAALNDAGISPSEVDALSSYTMEQNVEVEVARSVGLGDITYFSQVGYGGGAGCAVVGHAAMAVATGQANVAVAWRSRPTSDGRRPALAESTTSMSMAPNIIMMSSSWSSDTMSDGRASFTSS